jgi:glycosyltransferase involved in cell wall biosynthesis
MSDANEPLVSICMPAYNVAATAAEALQSVLAQSWRNIEVIVVDDGSSDGTSDVIRSVADSRVRLYRNENNCGGYQTMNRAVALACGEFVAVYHTDDVYGPNIVEKEVAYLKAHPNTGAVFCNDHFIDDDGNIFGGASLPKEFRGRAELGYADVFPFLLRHKNILFCCPTFMTRREVLAAVGDFDAERFDIAADLDMWIRIVRQFPVGILDERLMRYRVSKKQWSSRYKRLRTSREISFDIFDHYIQLDGWSAKLSARDLIEYGFQCNDDETFRAENYLIRGDLHSAAELLRRRFEWRALATSFRRRKWRVVLVRLLMKAGLAMGIIRPLAQFLRQIEYGSAGS